MDICGRSRGMTLYVLTMLQCLSYTAQPVIDPKQLTLQRSAVIKMPGEVV